MSGKYDDMIDLPHPTSNKHPRMSIQDRAAIFSPFAALSGHGAAIAETARLTDQRMELDEDTKAELDQRRPRKRTTKNQFCASAWKSLRKIRRPFFLRTSEKGENSRLTVLAPAI